MTDFFNAVKNFVLKYQPAAGETEVMGMTIKQYESGGSHGYRLDHFDKCRYVVNVSEKNGVQNIWAQENCAGNVTDAYDENGDGKIGKGESVTIRASYYTSKEKPKSNPNEFYQGVIQRAFLEGIGRFSSFEQFISPEALRDKEGFLFFGKDRLEAESVFSNSYLREALEKTKTILAKVQPHAKENQTIAFGVSNEADFFFNVKNDNVPTIWFPTNPQQGHNVLTGFILTMLNVPQYQLDDSGKRAIEMFTAYMEMKGGFESLINYCINNKIYPANLVPMMEQQVLKKVEEAYQNALDFWQNGNAQATLNWLLEENGVKRELAKRPPPSGSDQSLALDQREKEITALFNKATRLKKLVDEKKTEEVVQLLKAEGLIHPEKLAKQAKEGNFREIEITGVSWDKEEGHLLLDVQFESDCGGHHRLLTPKITTEPFSLHHFRKLEENYKKYISDEESGCVEKKSSGVSLNVGWRGGEYTRFFSHGETLSGGPKFQWTSHFKENSWEEEHDFVTFGWAPLLRRLELGGGEMNQARAGSFGGGMKFSYQREEFEKDSPDNILKLGFDMRGRYYPFHSISHLDRFSIGFDADIGILAGLAFKDGLFNDLQWVPIWAGIWAMAGVDF